MKNRKIITKIEIQVLILVLTVFLFTSISSAQTIIGRDSFSNTYLLEKGKYQTEIYSYPINIFDNNEYKPFTDIVNFSWDSSQTAFKLSWDNINLMITPYIVYINNSQYKLNELKNLHPELSYIHEITKSKKYNYGINITNIPLTLQNNIKQLEFRLTNLNGITQDDVKIDQDSIIIKDTIKLSFSDIPSYGFTYNISGKTSIIITNASNKAQIIIDPKVELTSGNITNDGHIKKTGFGVYSRDTTATAIKIGYDGTDTYRGYIEFNTSSIPAIADIDDVKLNLTFTGLGTYNCDVNPLELRFTASDQNLYNDIGNGTAYIDNNAFCKTGAPYHSELDLGGNGDINLQDTVSEKWFGVGIKWDNDGFPNSGTLAHLYSSESTFDPILKVTYNLDLTYDANGNLIKGLGKYYEYDSFNQLNKIRKRNETGDLIAEYFYDTDGNRIKKIEYKIENNNNKTTYYISDNFIQIRYSNGTILNETYYYANGKLLAKKDNNGNKTYYHPDHLGSTTLATNQSGHVIEEEFYLPFGDVYSGAESSRYLFTGKELDKVVDLYYYGARYYQASIMRLFIQPDSIIANIYDPQNLNRYSYVLNNPYKYTDPTGNYVSPLDALDYISLADSASNFVEDPTWGNFGYLAVDAISSAIPGIGGAGALAKVARGADKVAGAVKGAEKAGEALKGAEKLRGAANPNTKSSIEYGLKQHGEFYQTKSGEGFLTNKQIPGTKLRPDALSPKTNTIIELKPDSPSGLRTGQRQIERYEKAAKESFGGKWKAFIETYKSKLTGGNK